MTRKEWEIEQTVNALKNVKGEILGIGAGIESTISKLSLTAKRVFATDLYIDSRTNKWHYSPQLFSEPWRFLALPCNINHIVIQHMDARLLLYDKESFDGIFSSSSLEHFGTLDDIRQSIKEMHKVLKPNRLVALATELRLNGPADWLIPNECYLFDSESLLNIFEDFAILNMIQCAHIDDEEPTDLNRYLTDMEYQKQHLDHKILVSGDKIWTSIFLLLRKS